jgi:AcrR family transcriptional regulator
VSTEIAPSLSKAALPTDRRQRRKAETHQRLLDAASRVFAAPGVEAPRPQDIAREADVAIGTFYLHFADRREAFEAFTVRAATELMERARAGSSDAGSFEARLRRYLGSLLDYMDEKPGVVRAAFADEAVIGSASGAASSPGTAVAARAESLRERLAHGLARGLEQGMARGRIYEDYDPLLVSHGVVGLIQQILSHGSHRTLDRDVVLDQITRFCARALVPNLPSSGLEGAEERPGEAGSGGAVERVHATHEKENPK